MIQTRRELVREMSAFATPRDLTGTALALSDAILLILAMLGAVAFDNLGLRVACGLFAGVKLGNLLVLAHDVAHEALVASPRLSRALTWVCFLPCLHNPTLWIVDHHGFHHPNCNGEHKGTYTPFSLEQFNALPRWRQLLERFYRSGNPIGLGLHYLRERWLWALVVPWRRLGLSDKQREAAVDHLFLLVVFVVLFVATLLVVGSSFGRSPIETLLVGVALPYAVFFCLVGFVEFSQHTHPDVAWFQDKVEKPYFRHSELVSVHLKTPRVLGWLMHDVLDHPVHHLHAKVPCYRLREAQGRLNALLGEHAVVDSLSWRWYWQVMRNCKLFDFNTHAWVGFDGHATAKQTKLFRLSIAELDGAELADAKAAN